MLGFANARRRADIWGIVEIGPAGVHESSTPGLEWTEVFSCGPLSYIYFSYL